MLDVALHNRVGDDTTIHWHGFPVASATMTAAYTPCAMASTWNRKASTRFTTRACFHALIGDNERALDLPEWALAQGEGFLDWIQHDADLNGLRELPRYRV
jgi:hypothetical protein